MTFSTRKFVFATAVTLAASSTTFAALSNYDDAPFDGSPSLNAGIDDLVAGAVEWNAVYGSAGFVYDGYLAGYITDGAIRDLAVSYQALWDYVAVGDFSDPSSVQIVSASQDPNITDEQYRAWYDAMDQATQIGQEVWVLWWNTPNLGIIPTLALIDNNTVANDNILSSVALASVDPLVGAGLGGAPSSSFGLTIKWIWGSTRGRIDVSVKAICEDGELITCQETCDAWMSIGTATVKCETTKEGNCCKTKYSYGWGTPLVDVEVARDGFTVTASGIGSSGDGNGSVIDCCEDR